MEKVALKKAIKGSLLILTVLVLIFGPTQATKPGEEVNPNGFPSGKHYNLNIIAKKPGFNSCEPEVDEFGNIIGNVIYVPEGGQGIEIYMQSGRKGKKAEEITTLKVIDPCAFFDGDGAILQLPKNEFGYDVYARALAKPTYNPWMEVVPSLFEAEDEDGNFLVWLGLVTDNGFVTQSAKFERKKGKSRAVPITDLFMWSGKICYILDDPTYCDPCTSTLFCAKDTDLDGVYDDYIEKGIDPCPLGYDPVTLFCKSYDIPTWVFNIADFVTYLWTTNNHGLKLLQIRFYPRTESELPPV